ncbi:MAG TPA: decarboxylating 6-phosphogluconate dehydrogenase [Steroidobacteraceae bacterium]|nr:decarboxylating 6-phosphogluconate dehydrogenase [Steroidobacteraceae bacterium]
MNSANRPAAALVGLGKMGANMTRRLARAGLPIVAFDAAAGARAALADEPAVTASASLGEAVGALAAPRIVWLMLPAGAPTTGTIDALLALLARGDVIVDGGNADYRDSQRHAAAAAARGIHLVDAGVSGGVWGLANGYGLMLGGAPEALELIAPLVRSLAPAPDRGWVHCGPAGSGHYVKMIHNGIEYGLMQAYAEGFALLRDKTEFGLDVAAIAASWRDGSVVRSWLLELAADVLAEDATFDRVAPVVADSGEGRWTVREAIELGVPAPVITAALMQRFASQGRDDYAARFLARLRHAFGGHAVTRR